MTQQPIRMTDHALLRWLERAGLVDVEALRSAIEARLERGHHAALSVGAHRYTIIAHGLVYAVKGNSITTVMTDAGSGARGHNSHFQSAVAAEPAAD